MPRQLPEMLERLEFDLAAGEYLRWLKAEHPEHFMESPGQAQQRKVTVVAFDLMAPHLPGFFAYSELLLQTRRKKDGALVQVVPDNMVVMCEQEPRLECSYNVPVQPAGPFWVLEYVSRSNPRKDYQKGFPRYEKDFKVPYCLIYRPDEQEILLFRHNGRRYATVKPDRRERYAIPELDLELAVLDGWVRYWFRGDLLGLPADLQRELEQTRAELDAARRDNQLLRQQASRAESRASRAESRASQAEERAARLALLAMKLQSGTLTKAELAELQRLAGPPAP